MTSDLLVLILGAVALAIGAFRLIRTEGNDAGGWAITALAAAVILLGGS